MKKQVPVALDSTNSICGFCGVGCSLTLETKGDYVYRAVPDKNIEEGLLCARGRFGINHINDENRLKKPIIRNTERADEASFEDALLNVIKKLQAVRAAYGKDSIAFTVSPRLTNEEIFVVKKMAEKLETGIVGSFSLSEASGLKEILGYDASTTSYDELQSTDMILSVGNVAENHPVMGIKLKNAAAGKARLVSISQEMTRAEEWAVSSLHPANDLAFLKGIIKALMNMGYVNEAQVSNTAVNLEELKKFVENTEISKDISSIAKLYGEAKKAVIVIDEDTVSSSAIKLLADIAVICGKVGNPHRGIILVRSKNNSQGLLDMGVSITGNEILNLISSGKVKALVAFGEDPASGDSSNLGILQRLDFFGVGDIMLTDTAVLADVVLPLASTAETLGTFTRSDRKIQEVKPALEPASGKTNLQVLLDIAKGLGISFDGIKAVRENIAKEVPEYSGLNLADLTKDAVYWPTTPENSRGKQGLYSNGFKTSDGKAHLAVPGEGTAFKERVVCDTIEKQFANFAKVNGVRI